MMAKESMYEKILSKYKENVEEWREFMYMNMPKLMWRNPLTKHIFNTYSIDDIYSIAFMIADEIILWDDEDNIKISKLWHLFCRGWQPLYGKLNKFYRESYCIEEETFNSTYEIEESDELFNWVLMNAWVLSPTEVKIIEYLKDWRGKYEIAELLWTTYYNIKTTIKKIVVKIEKFLEETDTDADDSKS